MLVGKILTIIDSTNLSDRQNKAVKDLIKEAIGESLIRVDYYDNEPSKFTASEVCSSTKVNKD